MSENQNNPNTSENGGTKPFWLDFRFEDSEATRSALDADEPKSKGEIYFANPTRSFHPAAPAPAPEPMTGSQAVKGKAAKGKEKGKKSGSGGGILITALLALVLLAAAALSYMGVSTLRDIFAQGKNPDTAFVVSLSIADGQTTDQVIDLLADNKLVSQRYMCKLYMRFTEYIQTKNDDEPELPEYVAGEYEVDSAMGLEEMLGLFLPKPPSGETAKLLFAEGFTVKQIMEKIGDNRVSNVNLLKRSMLATQFDAYPFLRDLNTAGRYWKYEGYLFPDTYEFFIDENANSALRKFFDNFQGKWKEEYTTRATELGYTIDQIIILASIIQKEAGGQKDPEENLKQMREISGVLHNRLDHPSVYPMLECDSTRDYVLNNIATEMDPGAAEMYNETYNTYRCTGLPVGPICSPGVKAIEAALNPDQHDYFYFQHDKNGEIYLNKTRDEHRNKTFELVRDGLAL